ncbi:hypothetical protein EOPP23_04435 [Endozoicomonas sp. OPT23]|uniref:ZrgA family zinc uptake protein n=1 Tax=Endozoicomonas sp. OPT23 TaxID=2072845 RepID=UPI00129A9C6D|nr:DUF2796 domain-containing protein [Endozoicomonas sp. OPT23]MRI32240.1 hypothetical protein [Endozoicomonas sp. OPT23]
MFTPLKAASAVLLCTAISTAASAEGTRHADAHIHGEGQLNFAIDGRDIHLELEVPANDILGFESITTDQQKAQLKEALKALESDSLWQFTEAAQCQLIAANALSGEEHEEEGEHHDDHDKHHEKHDDHHEKHESGDHDKHHDEDHKDEHDKHHSENHDDEHEEHHGEEGSAHLDISATYHYRCDKPQAVNSLKTTLFTRFKNSEELAVQGFTDRGQVSLELTRKHNKVTF